MASEKQYINDLLVDAARRLRACLFRVNTGKGWVGQFVRKTPDGTVTLRNARPLHAGLCNGGSDVIGWTPIVVTQEMVGRTVAVFTAIEEKVDATVTTDEQEAFVRVVRENGGIAFIHRTPDRHTAADYLAIGATQFRGV